MSTPLFIPYCPQHDYTEAQMLAQSLQYFDWLNSRRSIRHFDSRPVPEEVIANLIKTASTAPSGAHKQPWTFCAISNPILKAQIRAAAEAEEYHNYHGRMSEEWLTDLAPIGTDWHKPFLETAPWLIVIFRRIYEENEDATKKHNYYVNESVGIATGFLLTAIHNAGLVTLTHTPSPMGFLSTILQRPKNEKPFLLLPIGYPAPNAEVPNLVRKPLSGVSQFYR